MFRRPLKKVGFRRRERLTYYADIYDSTICLTVLFKPVKALPKPLINCENWTYKMAIVSPTGKNETAVVCFTEIVRK